MNVRNTVRDQAGTGTSARIRTATEADAPRLVELHCQAFDVSTNHLLLLGRGFLRRFFVWYCATDDAFLLVAETETGVAGYIAVNHGSYYLGLRANWPHALLGFATHPTLFFHPMFRPRLKALLADSQKVYPFSWQRAYLAYLAIDHAMGGKGVAPALIRAALNKCQSRGWYEVVTSMHPHNLRARSLYAMMGFEDYSEPYAEGLASVRIKLHPEALLERSGTVEQGVGKPR